MTHPRTIFITGTVDGRVPAYRLAADGRTRIRPIRIELRASSA